jgi:hypothetical protein
LDVSLGGAEPRWSYPAAMALASLAISIFALLVAGASAVYTRSQSRSTEIMAKNDAARRREERTPDIELEVEPVNNGGWYRLWLRLLGKEPLTDVTVEIVEPAYVRFTQGTDGVDRNPDLQNRVGRTGSILIGGDFAWRVEWRDQEETPKSIRLKIACRGSEAGDVWFMTKVVDVPQPAQAFVAFR